MVDAWTKAPSYLLTLEILDPKTDIAGLPEGVTFIPDGTRAKRTATGRSGAENSNPRELPLDMTNLFVIKGDIPPGTELRFKGVVDAWTKTPSYVLTLQILDPKTDIAGLPEGVTFIPDGTYAKRTATGRSGVGTPIPREPPLDMTNLFVIMKP
jgi:hypothetical protein